MADGDDGPGVADVQAVYDREAQARVERVASDPAAFMDDPDRLATFIEKLRASGVRSFAHPSGLTLTFETTRAGAANW